MSTQTLPVKDQVEDDLPEQEPVEEKKLGNTSEEQEPVEEKELGNTPEEQPNKTELMKSLSNVVDYITDAVAEKVSQNVSASQFGEKQQNGFESVNNAAEIMATSGGKRKKTRKFKLTNKKKTRHNK